MNPVSNNPAGSAVFGQRSSADDFNTKLNQWQNRHARTREIGLAKERILECQRNGSEGLDLRGLSLGSLPDLRPLTNLRILDIRDNQLENAEDFRLQLPDSCRVVFLQGNPFIGHNPSRERINQIREQLAHFTSNCWFDQLFSGRQVIMLLKVPGLEAEGINPSTSS